MKRSKLAQLKYDLKVLNLFGGNNPDLEIQLAKIKLQGQINRLNSLRGASAGLKVQR